MTQPITVRFMYVALTLLASATVFFGVPAAFPAFVAVGIIPGIISGGIGLLGGLLGGGGGAAELSPEQRRLMDEALRQTREIYGMTGPLRELGVEQLQQPLAPPPDLSAGFADPGNPFSRVQPPAAGGPGGVSPVDPPPPIGPPTDFDPAGPPPGDDWWQTAAGAWVRGAPGQKERYFPPGYEGPRPIGGTVWTPPASDAGGAGAANAQVLPAVSFGGAQPGGAPGVAPGAGQVANAVGGLLARGPTPDQTFGDRLDESLGMRRSLAGQRAAQPPVMPAISPGSGATARRRVIPALPTGLR